jgi:hypothetical protein
MCESYQEQVGRLVQALGRAECSAVLDDLQSGSLPQRLKLFVDSNGEKRFNKLNDQLEFVAEAFEDFEHLIEVYIRQRPLAAYDSGVSDGERMLLWLLDKRPLTPVQRDYVLCQRGRHAVEELARCHRQGHVAFQKLRRQQPSDVSQIDLTSAILHLNPIRANATFITRALLDSESDPPTEVLFFPDGHEIATAVLEPQALHGLLTLAGLAPCRLFDWAKRLGVDPSCGLSQTAVKLLNVGLLAADMDC